MRGSRMDKGPQGGRGEGKEEEGVGKDAEGRKRESRKSRVVGCPGCPDHREKQVQVVHQLLLGA